MSTPLSLDSLSSPSPSPSPPPPQILNSRPPDPVLDSDSELSELTDDDQDPATSADRRERPSPPPTTALPASNSLSSSSAPVANHANSPAPVHRPTRGSARHTRTTSYSRRGTAPRKKRSSLVPAPMWGWAEAKAASSTAPVEEEEEEMAGPPRAMEEEEDEPDDPEEDEEERFDTFHHHHHHHHNPDDSAVIDQEDDEDAGNTARARLARRQGPTSSRIPDRPEHHLNGDSHENASASGSEYNSPKKKKLPKTRPPVSTTTSRKRKGSGASGSDPPQPPNRKTKKLQRQDEQDDDGLASDASPVEQIKPDDEHESAPPPIPPSPSKFLPSSKPLSAIAASSINPAAAALAALAVIADSVENVTETAIVSDPPTPALATNSSSTVDLTPAVSRSRTPSPDNSDRDEEPAEPQPTYRNKRTTRRIPPRSKKVSDDWRRLGKQPGRLPNSKKSSIDLKIDTALDNVPAVEPVNDDTEGMEVEGDADEETEKNAEEEEDAEEEVSQHDEDAQPTEDAGDDEPADPEGEGDGDEDQEQDADTNEVENEQENENENEEEENEEEASPEADLEDQEIELQPAHRAEALDVLASIELKFAMLRERVYVEKMEILAWEESMIQASVHPEMQYLQKEMTKRREKRLELASRKRSYEVANATKRRRADEDGVWSWWKLSVDELQTDMIAETNRKRRKLERERRALERPQPIRRIPPPPTDLPLIPPQSSLRKLLKSYPFVHKPIRRRRHRHSRTYQPKNLVYPEIPTLSVMDINHDLEFLYQNRRMPSSYDLPFGGPPPLWGQGSVFAHRSNLAGGAGLPGLGRPVGMGLNGGLPSGAQNQAVMQPMHPLAYEQYPEGGSRLRDVYTHPGGPPSLPGSRDPYLGYSARNQPSPSHGTSTPNMMMGNSGLGYPMEHEMPSGGHQLMPNHPHFGQGPPSNFRPSSSHGSNLKGRRTPSPPRHLSNGMPGSKSNGNWINAGMGTFQVNNGKGGDRDARHDDDERDRLPVRDRDRRRERDKEMERRNYWEKDYPDPDRRDLPHMHPSSSSLQYSQVPTPGPGADGHHHHHRPHHIHVLHRHGPPPLPPPSPVHAGSGGALPIVHSPKSVGDVSGSSSHPTTEGVMNKPQPPPREREIHWSQRNMDMPSHHSPSMHDYRERDKDLRKHYSNRPPSRPVPVDERNDRPISTPFVMPSSSHMNGSGVGSSTSSPGQAIWADDPSYRMPPAGYMGGMSSHEAHRSPVQAQRYTPGPSGRNLPPASSIHRIVSPPPPPPMNRARRPPSPYSHSSNLHRSPPASPRLVPRSPSSTKPLLSSGRTVTPTGQRPPSSSHTPLDSHLKNGTTTTNYGRTESPHMTVPSSRQGLNGSGGGGDVERHPMSALSPRLGLHSSKMSATTVGDRR